MKISVSIITYNRADVIGRCLEALARQTRKPLEVIVVDGSPNLATRKAVARFGKRLPFRYKHAREKLYQPQARNVALKMAKGDIIAFLDDDAIPDEAWLDGIESGYTSEDIAGVGGPCINVKNVLLPYGSYDMEPREKIIRSERNLNFVTAAGEIVSESRRWIPPAAVRTQMMAGGNMSFLTKKLIEAGGFDKFYGRHAAFREESDPQIALLRKGYGLVYSPRALVWHLDWKSGGIFSESMKDYYYWCGVNHRYLVDKYGFSKFLSRLSWLTFSRSPPSLPLGLLLAVARRNASILQWYRGLFGWGKTRKQQSGDKFAKM